jgi:DNA-binding NtrC family response regulator
LLGELGTGKELVARALHRRSLRADGPFVAARCSGAESSHILREWFGDLRGDAVNAGAFALATGGTLYLRDVGDMAADLQDALFAALSTRRFVPVDGTTPLKLNVRLLSATDRNLATLVSERRFREDLYYLLSSHTMSCPSLRDRREDIPLLVDYFLARFCRQARHRPMRIAPAALTLLAEHDWPGNVRELEGVLEEAALRATGDTVDVEDLRLMTLSPATSPVPTRAEELKRQLKALRADAVVELERLFVVRALERSRGNVSAAARQVGMKRPNFQALMRRHRVRSGEYELDRTPEPGQAGDDGQDLAED